MTLGDQMLNRTNDTLNFGLGTTSNSTTSSSGPRCHYEEEERERGRRRRDRDEKQQWLPKFTQSAIDCIRRSVSRGKPGILKSDGGNDDANSSSMTELYYHALQSELCISNPYLYDAAVGRSTPNTNAELYRRSWKLDPFPALMEKGGGDKRKRRCRSESNVARNSVLVNNRHSNTIFSCNSSSAAAVVDDDTAAQRKKSWFKESRIKFGALFRRKCDFLFHNNNSSSNKRTDSVSDLQKQQQKSNGVCTSETKGTDYGFFGDTSSGLIQSSRCNAMQMNGIHFSPSLHQEDDINLTGSYPHGCEPTVWRDKLERWAASLQCAIQVIKREESMKQEINRLRTHREVLERQLEEIMIEKERWRRKCIQLQKEKRRSVEGLSCKRCGGGEFQLRNGKFDNVTSGVLVPPPHEIPASGEDIFRARNFPRRFNDDEIFKALHDLMMYSYNT